MRYAQTSSPVRTCIVFLLLGLVLIGAGGRSHLKKGHALLERGKTGEAVTRFQKALARFTKQNDQLGLFSAYEGLGDAERSRSNAAAAISYYKQAERYGRTASAATLRRVQTKVQNLEDEIYRSFIGSSSEHWETYDAFSSQHPENHNRIEALRRRDELQYRPYREGGTLADHVSFLDRFPDNSYAREALEKVYSDWQGWDSGDPSTASDAYDRFLATFSDSDLRAAAHLMRAYYQALTATRIDTFATFYQLYDANETALPLLDSPALARLRAELVQFVERSPSARGFLLLHERTRQRQYLEQARDLVSNAREEAYFVELNPHDYFEIGEAADRARAHNSEPIHHLVELTRADGIGGALLGLYLPKSETTVRPVLELPLRSRTRYVSYTLELDFELEVEVEAEGTGVFTEIMSIFSDVPTSYSWTETYESRAQVELNPRSYSSVEVVFQEISAIEQRTFAGIAGYEIQRRVAGMSYELRSVTWKDGHTPRVTQPALGSRELRDFRRAQRSFNELVRKSRSSQIDQLENIARDGLIDQLRGGNR